MARTTHTLLADPRPARLLALALTLGALSAAPAAAQDTAADDAAPEGSAAAPALPLGEIADEDQIGRPYILETHGDWELRCIKTEDGNDPCNLYQLLEDENGNGVAEVSLFELNQGEVDAAVTVIAPLETLLTQPLRVQVDSGETRVYPYQFCNPVGCYARFGLSSETVDAYRNGTAATLTLVPMAAPDERVELSLSLRGFTAGYAAVAEINADN